MPVDTEQREHMDESLGYRAGLLFAFRMDAKGGGHVIGWPEIDADRMGSLVHGDLWIHMDRSAPRVERWLTGNARVPEQAAEMLLAEDPRPKFVHFTGDEQHPEGFVLILRSVNLNPNADPENMVAIRLWVDEHRVISLRKRKVMAEEVLDHALRSGIGPLNSADLINHLTNAMMDRIDAVVDELEGELDEAEDRLEDSDADGVRLRIGEIRRSAIRLKRYLAPQREVLNRAGTEWPEWISKKERLRLRARAERVARVVEDIDELITRAGFAQDELHARLAERMNRSNVGLTVVATVFLPMSLVASMWGMNTEQLPFSDHENGFWIVNGFIALTGIALAVFSWRMSKTS